MTSLELGPVGASVLLGLAIAAPLGPVNVLCVRRTLADGWWPGLVSGLGAAAGDGVFAVAAVAGFGRLAPVVAAHADAVRLGTGCILLAAGLAICFARAPRPASTGASVERSLPAAFLSTFALTLANPLPLLTLGAAFAGAGAAHQVRGVGRVAGVLLGSALWWLLLASAVRRARGRLGARALSLVNPLAGAALALFGVAALASLWLGGPRA